jgi:hypothetical protein
MIRPTFHWPRNVVAMAMFFAEASRFGAPWRPAFQSGVKVAGIDVHAERVT